MSAAADLLRCTIARALPSILSIAVTFAVLRFTQRSRLRKEIETDVETKGLPTGGKIAGLGLGAAGIALIASSACNLRLGLSTFTAGLATLIVVLAIKRDNPWHAIRDIPWAVIPLVARLFVLVEALETTGVPTLLAAMLKGATGRSKIVAGALSGVILAFGTNLANNLPVGLLAGEAVQTAHVQGKVAGAILVGVDLGPNLSVTGSLATILWLTVIRREGQDISFWTFLKLGILVMPPALAAALAALR